jgi:triosephosphate isomerase
MAMTRRKLVAGNWKMNGSLGALTELDAIAAAAETHGGVDVAVAVPATLIAPAVARVPALMIGAQDVHAADKGAHTGCISAAMAKEAGARFSIVGHSERRADQGETNADVKAKAEALHGQDMQAIVCVGETLDEREAGRAEAVVTAQVAGSLPEGASGDWCAIAYEPVWAIGTGRTPTADDVAAMHGAIRAKLRAMIGDEADRLRILYGGSVTPDNARELLHVSDVDGALVGGASLTAAKFVPIIAAAD